MRSIFGAALIAVASITACSSEPPPPTASSMAAANIGDPPANYEQLIKSYYSERLIDPASAMYGPMTPPRRGSLRPYFAGGMNAAPIVGYVVCGTINSKNRMGGYAGAKAFAVAFVNGSVAYAELPTMQCM